MKNTFRLVIKTPLNQVFDQEVESISFKALDGQAQVFAKHADLTAAIAYTHLNVQAANFNDYFVVTNATLNFDNKTNTCYLMALRAVDSKHEDKLSAQKMIEKIESKLKEGKDISKFKLVELEDMKVALQEETSA